MERLAPEILRAYADALEERRRFINIERCMRVPELDQTLLLALNRKKQSDEVPAERVTALLRDMLISVSFTDPKQESTVLGYFFTNHWPYYRKMRRFAVGVFPLYGEIARYNLHPRVKTGLETWQDTGHLAVEDPSASRNDPFLIKGVDDHPDFIFFNKSPEDQAYQAILPDSPKDRLKDPVLYEDALERNVIRRALWYTDRWAKPYLFLQNGFKEFIREHRHDPRYKELYEGYRRHVFPNTGYAEHNI